MIEALDSDKLINLLEGKSIIERASSSGQYRFFENKRSRLEALVSTLEIDCLQTGGLVLTAWQRRASSAPAA